MSKLMEAFPRHYTDQEALRASAERTEILQDAGRFFGTRTYADLRKGIEHLIRDARFVPGMTQEQAAQTLIEQSAYRNIERLLDNLVAIVKEHADGR